MISKMQRNKQRIIRRPGEKHCMVAGLSRRPTETLEWKEAEEELRSEIPEFRTTERALDGPQMT